MKSKLFIVYDSKAGCCEKPPFGVISRGAMLREWQMMANDAQSQFSRFPGDYTLFEIGEFDHVSGVVSLYEAKVSLGTALEFKNKAESEAPLLKAIEDSQKAGE